MRRIGVFGGSFDPPHVGHVLVASDAVEALALDQLLFVPAAQQPLKHAAGARPAPADLRLGMLDAALGDDPRFGVDRLEIERGGLSFTVDTLQALGARWPGAELFLLVGADALATFARWRDPLRIRALATCVVLTRAADAGDAPDRDRAAADFPGGPPRFLATRRVDVSSTEVRARVAAGLSIRGFVAERVAELIRSAGLYR